MQPRNTASTGISDPRPYAWLGTGDFYDPLPILVTCDRGLGALPKLLYARVAGLSKKDGVCTMGQRSLADLLGCSRETVSDGLGCLTHAGHLRVRERVGSSNEYWPAPLREVYSDNYRAAVDVLAKRAYTPEQLVLWRKAEDVLTQHANQHRKLCPTCHRRQVAAKARR